MPYLKGGQGRTATDHEETVACWAFCLVVAVTVAVAYLILKGWIHA